MNKVEPTLGMIQKPKNWVLKNCELKIRRINETRAEYAELAAKCRSRHIDQWRKAYESSWKRMLSSKKKSYLTDEEIWEKYFGFERWGSMYPGPEDYADLILSSNLACENLLLSVIRLKDLARTAETGSKIWLSDAAVSAII